MTRALEFLALIFFLFSIYAGFELIGAPLEQALHAGLF